MTKKKYKPFDAPTVPLNGSNLIEASAGTGKTYSIAILVLRLVLEKEMSIKEVLMVTFTKAAVAELEERVRLFIRTAYKASLGKTIADKNIDDLVKKAIDKTGGKDTEKGTTLIQQLLREAVLFLDETSVLTIHSFCQQTLQEFAFETDQLFGTELVPDLEPVLEVGLNDFWRRHITTMDPRFLKKIWHQDMKYEIKRVIQEHLSGKHYLGFDEKQDYRINAATQNKWLKQLTALDDKEARLSEALHGYVVAHGSRLVTVCEGNAYARKGLIDLIATPPAFLESIKSKRAKSAYITKLFPDILERLDACEQVTEERDECLRSIRQQLYGLAIKEAGNGIRNYKERNNILGYDDLIDNLHSALVKRDNPALEQVLRKKYKAVFIDEFQDTDRQQYELFHKAFGGDTILFYIGDPKQSIYGWRKADIFTYFLARSGVGQVYTMNVNFRSSAGFIAAMNQFFLPGEDFDTFYFSGESNAIDYIPVESPEDNTKGELYKGAKKEVPLSIRSLPVADIAASAAATVAELLQNKDYSIKKANKRRQLVPGDIGILVRKKQEALEIKTALSRLGIPAVTLDDSKVLESEEARYLLYLLEAIEEPSRSSINRAMLSQLTGYTIADILLLDDESILTLFGKYRTRWHVDGVYTALMDFVADLGVRHVLLRSHAEEGERIITNFMQLAEIVHQMESRKSLTTVELISWLRRSIDGMATEGDEYVQRIENDEQAVKIVTIHKSKGLEYNIVLAPYLEFNTGVRREFVSFRDPATGDYVGAETKRLTEEQRAWQQQQLEQENRRLLYVALTRTVYKCYIFQNEKGRASTLSVFTAALREKSSPSIVFEEGAIEAPAGWYRNTAASAELLSAVPAEFSLVQDNWRKLSYTLLAAKPTHGPRPRTLPGDDDYDSFVFQTLRRGVKTGELLHFLFEHIHFSDDSRWEKWIEEGIRRFAPAQRDLYLPGLRRLLPEVLNANIPVRGDLVDGGSFTLSEIGAAQCITEFEFDFPVGVFQPVALNSLSGPSLSVTVKDFRELGGRQLEGIMNGRIDLFFEYEGRYYILDWKTNHLGSTVESYSGTAVEAAMRDNNYDLQYLIYTLAAKKYLESRLPAFDYDAQFGGVIFFFVRGARSGGDRGIYSTFVPRATIGQLEKILTYAV